MSVSSLSITPFAHAGGVGAKVGTVEGEVLGMGVGTREGNALGGIVGDPVGSRNGDSVGVDEGKNVGLAVGFVDGGSVGATEGTKVGNTQRPMLRPHVAMQKPMKSFAVANNPSPFRQYPFSLCATHSESRSTHEDGMLVGADDGAPVGINVGCGGSQGRRVSL
jgi:hypothetical protein